jgi:hypothetical protein
LPIGLISGRLELAQASQRGEDTVAREGPRRRWWDALIVAGAVLVFVWLARIAQIPPIRMRSGWTALLVATMLFSLWACGALLWKRTRFS